MREWKREVFSKRQWGKQQQSMIFLQLSNEKQPGCLGCIGDYTSQICGDYSKPFKGSWWNNQYFMESTTVFFCGSIRTNVDIFNWWKWCVKERVEVQTKNNRKTGTAATTAMFTLPKFSMAWVWRVMLWKMFILGIRINSFIFFWGGVYMIWDKKHLYLWIISGYMCYTRTLKPSKTTTSKISSYKTNANLPWPRMAEDHRAIEMTNTSFQAGDFWTLVVMDGCYFDGPWKWS